MSGKSVDIITTWREAAIVLGVSYKGIKSMYADYADSDLPMPIDVHGRRVLTTAAALQKWVERRAEWARQAASRQKK